MQEKLLEVENLRISFSTGDSLLEVVSDVSFDIDHGQTIGIVGESGSGKSVSARAIMQLLGNNAEVGSESVIKFNGEDILSKSEKEMRRIRGNDIGMIFQDPMTSLNPTMKVGKQISETIRIHENASKKEAAARAKEIMRLVGIPNVDERFDQYPFEFSGGMRQRIIIAIALACSPKLLIADEPTTALDVTIQAQILDLLKDIQEKTGTSILLITHDFGVVANMCEKIVVMNQGRVVESGTTSEIFTSPKEDYTKKLLAAIPNLHEEKSPESKEKLIQIYSGTREKLMEVNKLAKHFPIGRKNTLKAVDSISFDIYKGETLGLVGESGSGKSTTGRTLLRLHEATSGETFFEGEDLNTYKKKQMKEMRKKVQFVFQDPYSSLNPRKKVEDIIGEALDIHKLAKSKKLRRERVEELLTLVGLDKSFSQRFPHEFSGGQRQRIGIARALAVEPEFIVLDEPLSALDASVQLTIVDLLEELQRKLNLTYLFIAHDLATVKKLSDRVAVMYKGQIVELTDSEELFTNPMHNYTRKLLSAIPVPDPHYTATDASFSHDDSVEISLEGQTLQEVKANHWVMQ
ncbi:ABC transporter ATP-binding protein [Alkalibacterium pelagium]|uniref:Peptide/nickel transport system ATP-binding protein n=1 Tax=Alkalibacterium pelagium TaxID=426702 RepID=A0A1H7IIM5_9LACT|nr:ABC transporter ATP-binding protein [Alkalibacterium pelagium]GEN50098.1 ABC transporter ATP-binding protein [Alkalibacterium pelagium]SEK62164.1 peptide/nickel transport system ATP-binding protein [Alkalibacterium pelagium]